MTTRIDTSVLKDLLNKRSDTFKVKDKYRTNSLSLVSGGVCVKVVFSNGTSRIYDKIKDPDAYIYHLLNYSDDDISDAYVITDDDFFDWD